MIFYFIGWKKTTESRIQNPESRIQNLTIVSIIIPARNEEENILKILDCLYKQTYPIDKFEIIVVDDHSSDRTAEFVYLLDIPTLKLVQLSEPRAGKKQAITEGIKSAIGNLIITTDADCEMGENWLSSIVSFYEEHTPKMIVAPVLLKGEKTIHEIFQSQEMTVLTASASASLYYNLPIGCNGANLVYEKEAFHSVNGFEGVDTTATGDDIFLMLKVHKK
ncbi:MAG: glycosyltransferase, partial [Bacteroidota bacterium]